MHHALKTACSRAMARNCAVVAVYLAIASLWLQQLGAQQDQAPQAKPPSVRSLAFSPDGQSLAVAFGGINSLVVWDIPSSTRKFAIKEKSGVGRVAFSSTGDGLAISRGKAVKLLDPESGQLRRELTGHTDSVRCLTFAPDGNCLLTGSTDCTIKLWNAKSGELLRTVTPQAGEVIAIAVSPDGKWVAAAADADNDFTVMIWPMDKLAEPHKIAARGYIPQVLFSPGGSSLAIPSWTASLRIVATENWNETIRLTSLGGTHSIAFSPDGRWLAAGYGNGTVLIELRREVDDEVRARIDRLIKILEDDDYAKREAASTSLAELGIAAFEPLRRGLESPSAEVRIRCRRLIQRIQAAEDAPQLTGHEAEVNWVAFSPEGKRLASGDAAGVVKLWDVAQRKEIATLRPE